MRIEADAPHPIRAVKILVRGLPRLTMLDLLDQAPHTSTDQIIRRYPNDARIPLVFVRTSDGVTLGARCDDPQARQLRDDATAVYQAAYARVRGGTGG